MSLAVRQSASGLGGVCFMSVFLCFAGHSAAVFCERILLKNVSLSIPKSFFMPPFLRFFTPQGWPSHSFFLSPIVFYSFYDGGDFHLPNETLATKSHARYNEASGAEIAPRSLARP